MSPTYPTIHTYPSISPPTHPPTIYPLTTYLSTHPSTIHPSTPSLISLPAFSFIHPSTIQPPAYSLLLSYPLTTHLLSSHPFTTHLLTCLASHSSIPWLFLQIYLPNCSFIPHSLMFYLSIYPPIIIPPSISTSHIYHKPFIHLSLKHPYN